LALGVISARRVQEPWSPDFSFDVHVPTSAVHGLICILLCCQGEKRKFVGTFFLDISRFF